MSDNFPFDFFLNVDTNKNTTPIHPTLLQPKSGSQEVNAVHPAKDENNAEINKEILSYLKEKISQQKFSTFFENTFQLISIANDHILFSVTTPFIKSMIENNLLETLKSCVICVLGKDYKISIITEDGKMKNSHLDEDAKKINRPIDPLLPGRQRFKTAKESKFSIDLHQSREEIESAADSRYLDHIHAEPIKGNVIDTNKRFDNFVLGPSNNMAYAAAMAIAKSPGKNGKYPTIYIYSDSGLGKTHLLHSVANSIKENHPELVLCITSAKDFLDQMVTDLKNDRYSEFTKRYTEKVDVLMIDDIHFVKSKEGLQENLFHIFNELHNRGKQILFTSDKPPKKIDGLVERLKTRLQWGLVVDIQPPDYETRLAILKRKASELDLFISEDVIELIARTLTSNIRELEGSLQKVLAYSELMNVEVDKEVAKEILKLKEEDQQDISLDSIVKAVSKHYKLHVVDLKSKSRNQNFTNARQVSMYIAKKIGQFTLVEIGSFFGGRDHSTVISGIRKIETELKTNVELSRDLSEIEKLLS